jgi:hypothetical protein
MRIAEQTTERLVLATSSPMYWLFLIGGLGLVALGIALPLWSVAAGLPLSGPLPGDESATPIAGLGAFLVPFGFFLVLTLRLGAVPYRQEIVVDRGDGRLTQSARSLRGFSQVVYRFQEIREVDVEEQAVEGDYSYAARAQLESGKSVALGRPGDRATAEHVAQLVRSYLTQA